MTLDEAIERYTSNAEYERTHENLQGCLEFRQLAERLKDYKRLLEQQPCADCISRQAVLSMQYRIDDSATLSTRDVVNVDDIEDLPSVTPQRLRGKWVDNNCSICGYGVEAWNNTPYCPNCGAKMESKE